MKWNVYEQLHPYKAEEATYYARFKKIGEVESKDTHGAFRAAKTAYPWLAHPVLHELDLHGRERRPQDGTKVVSLRSMERRRKRSVQ